MVFFYIELLAKRQSDHKLLITLRLNNPPKLEDSGRGASPKRRNEVVYVNSNCPKARRGFLDVIIVLGHEYSYLYK